MQTLRSLIEKNVIEFEKDIFLSDVNEYYSKDYSYNQIYQRALKICSFFKKEGIKKKDKIVLYIPNSSDYVSLLFACALSGVIAVPIDFNSNQEFTKKIYRITKSKIIFCSVFRKVQNAKNFYVEEMQKIYSENKIFKDKIKISPEDIFEIVYTSGTTSEPKGVMLTHKNVCSNVVTMTKIVTFSKKGLSFLSILPLSHLFEQNIGLFCPLNMGSRISYLSSKKSSKILESIVKQKISAVVCVPFFLESLKNKIQPRITSIFKKIIAKRKFSKLKYFIVGGSSLSLDTERFWTDMGFKILQGYGLTETSPVISCNSTKEYKEGTVGRVLEGIKMKIENKEIIVNGPNVFKEYYLNKESTEKVKKNEWFYTGDLGEIDKDGFLKVIGRKKNVIISSSGLNIYPEDIERVILNSPGIKDCVVLGLDNGQKITAVIIPEKKIEIETLKKETNSKLNSSQQLAEIIVWPEKDFPRTPTLKIIRREVESRLNNQIEPRSYSSDKLKNIISELCKISLEKISEEKKITELGLDSIKRIELVNKIEEIFNIEFQESKIDEKTTLGQLRKEIQNPTKDKSKSQITILNSKIFNPVRFILQQLSFLSLATFWDIETEGIENLPEENCILIANHSSMLDTFALYKSLPMKYKMNTCPAAAKDFFFKNKILGGFGKLTFNAFGFSRKGETKQSLKDFGELISRGMNVLIYPEGTRSRTGKMAEFKEGIGILAKGIDVPIVPIKLEGLHEILPVGKIWPKKGNVKIKIGKPIIFSKIQNSQDITKKLREIIQGM